MTDYLFGVLLLRFNTNSYHAHDRQYRVQRSSHMLIGLDNVEASKESSHRQSVPNHVSLKGAVHAFCHTSDWIGPWMLTRSNCVKQFAVKIGVNT